MDNGRMAMAEKGGTWPHDLVLEITEKGRRMVVEIV